MPSQKQTYSPNSTKTFKLSRSKIEQYIHCPRCFYLDRRIGISQPPIIPFTLNNAVDALLKKEFDLYRIQQQPHPIIKTAGIKAVPLNDPQLSDWQNWRKGLSYMLDDINVQVYGAVDDLWKSDDGELFVVDYKATSSDKEIDLNDAWKAGYKRQIEIYQWLLRKNGYKVSNTGYFVYANAIKSFLHFGNQLTFDTKLIEYIGDDTWVEDKIREIVSCLISDKIPEKNVRCELCKYVDSVSKYTIYD